MGKDTKPIAPAAPDIARPRQGAMPEWAWWVVGSAVLLGSVGAGAVYIKKNRQVDEAPQQVVTSSDIPDDFARMPERQEKAREAPPEKPPEPKPEPPKPKAVEVPPQKITAAQLFSPPPPQPATPPPPDPIEVLAEKRRSAGSVKVSRAGRIQEVTEWVNTQEEWDEEEKTIASYPTDLSRVITVDKEITAILKNAVNSELEGKVVAIIEENIYCAHGRNVCIPAGSQAVGRFKALKKAGDERIPVYWSRIITPQGINIHMGDAEMADAMGRSGITGDVDNRFMDRYGMALLVSSLSAATAYAVPVTTTGQQIVIQTYGSNLANLSGQILDKNMNLKPKVSIPAGQRILISPTKDIWFPKPERNNNVEAVALDSLQSLLRKKGGPKK